MKPFLSTFVFFFERCCVLFFSFLLYASKRKQRGQDRTQTRVIFLLCKRSVAFVALFVCLFLLALVRPCFSSLLVFLPCFGVFCLFVCLLPFSSARALLLSPLWGARSVLFFSLAPACFFVSLLGVSWFVFCLESLRFCLPFFSVLFSAARCSRSLRSLSFLSCLPLLPQFLFRALCFLSYTFFSCCLFLFFFVSASFSLFVLLYCLLLLSGLSSFLFARSCSC